MSTHKLLSAITGAVDGMLNLNEEEQSISSPITGRKHYIVDPDNPIPTGTIVTQPNPTLSYNSTTGEVTASYTPIAGVVQDTTEKSATLQLSPQGGNTVLLMHFNNSLEREGLPAVAGIVAQRINGMDAEMGGSGENWSPTYDTGHFGNALVFPPGADEWDYYNHQLILPVSGDLVSDDFTVEFWYVNTTGYDNNGILIKTFGAGHIIEFMARGGGSTQAVDVRLGNGSSWVVDKGGGGAVSPTTTDWHHVALVRYNDVFTCYIDGAVYWSQSCSSLTSISGNAMLQIGSLSTRFEGMIDELRISNIARYTAAFTPPTEPFTVD